LKSRDPRTSEGGKKPSGHAAGIEVDTEGGGEGEGEGEEREPREHGEGAGAEEGEGEGERGERGSRERRGCCIGSDDALQVLRCLRRAARVVNALKQRQW